VEHNHVRHEHIIVMAMETEPVPRIPPAERLEVSALGHPEDGIIHVTARYGYVEKQDVPSALRLLKPEQAEGRAALSQTSYFLSRVELRLGDEPTMARWRKHLFIATSHITADAGEHFGLPGQHTIIMGGSIDV